MMGTKIRNFAPLPDPSLEELVPKHNSLLKNAFVGRQERLERCSRV
jgi:hypothetical protein